MNVAELIKKLELCSKLKNAGQQVYIKQENGFLIDVASIKIDQDGDIIIHVEGGE